MTGASHDLTELEHDALTELVNLAVARAALSLREMAGEEVVLSVPAVSLVTPAQASGMIDGVRQTPLLAIEQGFRGEISGRALLIFPETNALELVRAVSGRELLTEDFADFAPDALCETGNVLIQACLGTMGNLLHRSLAIDAPHLIKGRAIDLFTAGAGGVVLFVYINFQLRGRRIRGYVALLLDLPAMHALKALIGEMIDRETS